jgi:uncharacterized damage-inducible protein DinB
VRELQTLQRELDLMPDDLSLWQTLPGVTNSVGNLGLHLAGNLEHFVGARLGHTGYVRNRDYEFAAREGTRASVKAALDGAIAAVQSTMATLTDADLARPYPDQVGGVQLSTELFLMHLCAHAAFHVGQAGYLRRILTASTASAGTVPLQDLAV